MNVTIFGTGYVGLVTATCLAEMGNRVTCVDVDTDKVARLENGDVPIYEPGLASMVGNNHAAGRLSFTTDPAPAVATAEIVFIAVGTPPGADGSADLEAVLTVAATIGRHLSAYTVVVDKSTVPVGTADRVHAQITDVLAETGKDVPFDVVSNPEFLKEGAAIEDCMRPDRIIIGSTSERATEVLRVLYAPFNHSHDRLLVMDPRSAEFTKYAANAMLATKISFMNEAANIAERVGADIESVRQGIGLDPRIGFHFIYPGVGYGGSCFPKDVQALDRIAYGQGYDAELMHAVMNVNTRQKERLFELLQSHFGGLSGRTIALWGLAFKPETDDMREAPSRRLMEALWAVGARVQAYDPQAREEARRLYGERDDLALYANPYAALEGADALVLVTEWKNLRAPDWSQIRAALAEPVVVDGRNIYDPAAVEAAGLAYYGISRGRSVRTP